MAKIDREAFGEANGEPVELFSLTNDGGMIARITNYGGILTELHVPDNEGKTADVVLGFDSLEPYLARHPYFGAIVGRFANRIADGSFTLDGEVYKLDRNEGKNHLHGGRKGFDKAVWSAEPVEDAEGVSLRLSLLSPDGDEGYPGDLQVTATYALSNDNGLGLKFVATTNRPTVVNLVNHSYWNLGGHGSGNILEHWLRIDAERFTVTGRGDIPTGEIKPVLRTPYDFTVDKRIGRDAERLGEEVGGFDMNFVVNGEAGTLRPAAILRDPRSGRVMEVHTTAPGMQFYSGFKLNRSLFGKGGVPYGPGAGLCLETQHFPDSPNRPDFPSTVLRPGETYFHETLYRFSSHPAML